MLYFRTFYSSDLLSLQGFTKSKTAIITDSVVKGPINHGFRISYDFGNVFKEENGAGD